MTGRLAHIKRLYAKKPDLSDNPNIYVDIVRIDEYDDRQNSGAQARTVTLKWLDDDEDSANTRRVTETKTITMPYSTGEIDVKAIKEMTTFNSGQEAVRIFKNSAENTKRVVAIKRIYQTNLAIEGEIDWQTFPDLWQAAQASKVASVYIDVAITKEFSTHQMAGGNFQGAQVAFKNDPLLDLMEDAPESDDVVYLDPYQIIVNIKARKPYIATRATLRLVNTGSEREDAPVLPIGDRVGLSPSLGPIAMSFMTAWHYEFDDGVAERASVFDEATGTWSTYDVDNILDTMTGEPSLAGEVYTAGPWEKPEIGRRTYSSGGVLTVVEMHNPYPIVENIGASADEWTYLVDGVPTPIPTPETEIPGQEHLFPMYFDESLDASVTLYWASETGTILNIYDGAHFYGHGTEGWSYSYTPPAADPGYPWSAASESEAQFTLDYSNMTWVDPDGQNYRAVAAHFIDVHSYIGTNYPSTNSGWPLWILYEPYEPDLP